MKERIMTLTKEANFSNNQKEMLDAKPPIHGQSNTKSDHQLEKMEDDTTNLFAEKSILQNNDVLEKEDDEGCIEYKWKLVNISEDRFKHLVSQMKYRLSEGQGEAIYEIGVNNDGIPLGLDEKEYKESLQTLERMAKVLHADMSIICDKEIEDKKSGTKKKVAEVLIRYFGEGEYMDLRIAVCGNVDSGKSTLVGVLTRGKLDNGRGLARTNVFLHKHEVQTGRTSSVSHQIMGFDSKGQIVNYNSLNDELSWKEIIEKSSKVCTFIDLAGHEKYLKTTAFGLTGSIPDYACILVGSNMGVQKMTKEHIGLCLALKLPIIFIITKIDICPENVLKNTVNTIHKLLKLPGVRKIPYHIRNEDDVITCAKTLVSDRICPIFMVSNVTGTNLDLLRKFFNLLPVRRDWEAAVKKSAEFFIDQTFFVPGVGTVISGIVTQGSISVNDTLSMGPDGNGQFRKVGIKSIHCKRVNVKHATAGQHASFALKKEKRSNIRKGMVLVEDPNPKAVWEFIAEVLVLYHSTTIQSNYQPVIHCMCVRQAAKIVSLEGRDSLRTGDKCKVRFRFMFRPEYIKTGERLIFREGRTKGLGVVTQLCTFANDPVSEGKTESNQKE